jgi:hypothetical protein
MVASSSTRELPTDDWDLLLDGRLVARAHGPAMTLRIEERRSSLSRAVRVLLKHRAYRPGRYSSVGSDRKRPSHRRGVRSHERGYERLAKRRSHRRLRLACPGIRGLRPFPSLLKSASHFSSRRFCVRSRLTAQLTRTCPGDLSTEYAVSEDCPRSCKREAGATIVRWTWSRPAQPARAEAAQLAPARQRGRSRRSALRRVRGRRSRCRGRPSGDDGTPPSTQRSAIQAVSPGYGRQSSGGPLPAGSERDGRAVGRPPRKGGSMARDTELGPRGRAGG